jgi:lipoyl-dependent peroxiredoxin
MATRNGSAEWRGDLKGGSGKVKVGDGVFEGNY